MKSESKSLTYSGLMHDKNEKYHGIFKIYAKKKVLRYDISENDPLLLFNNCLIDHSGRQFACIHGSCLENRNCFKNDQLLENLKFHELNFHPDDIMLWCMEAFPDIIKFIETISEGELNYYRFSFNQRYFLQDGSISQFLHDGTISLTDDHSHPYLNLKVFTEIGDIKTDETIILTIYRYFVDQGYQKVFTKIYGKNNNSLLSQREMEIINLCLQGLSSKMIAEKLNISIHTVKNHKRNCMEKTITHNIVELINLCMQNRWL